MFLLFFACEGKVSGILNLEKLKKHKEKLTK